MSLCGKEQSHFKLVTIGVLQTRGACHLGADHGDTHGRGRRCGQQARLHPCKWCTARTVLPNVSCFMLCYNHVMNLDNINCNCFF